MKETSEEFGLLLNVKKTKILVIGDELDQPLQVDQEDVEQVDTFNFLGSYIEKDGGSIFEIKKRLAKARMAVTSLTSMWKTVVDLIVSSVSSC